MQSVMRLSWLKRKVAPPAPVVPRSPDELEFPFRDAVALLQKPPERVLSILDDLDANPPKPLAPETRLPWTPLFVAPRNGDIPV